MSENKEIVIFESDDKEIKLEVAADNETVWLNRKQIAKLFNKDPSTIFRHIKNALKEELDKQVVVANFAMTTPHGAIKGKTQKHFVEYYNLDVIISVGYRVKSNRGVEFRKWANRVLRDYILRGAAINDKRLAELDNVVKILKRSQSQLETSQILNVVEQYTKALTVLDDYDHNQLSKPKGNNAIYVLNYEECKKLINQMEFADKSELFGTEKDDSFKGSIGNIYQSFDGKDVYPTLEEKAANLLYFITKNHSFLDGNKRIAATIFLYFLDKNDALFKEGQKVIDDFALAALTILIAESDPSEKETIVKLIMQTVC